MAAVIDLRVDPGALKRDILHLGPSLAPSFDLAALLLVQLARLFPKPLRAKAARRRQQVGMVIWFATGHGSTRPPPPHAAR
jgi:hypothetical protein